MRRILILITIVLLSNFSSRAQDSVLNFHIKKLSLSKPDTSRVIEFYTISRLYVNINADSTLAYANRAMALAYQLHYQKGIALSLLSKGIGLEPQGKYSEALNCYLKALTLSQTLNLPDLKNNIFNNIGIVYLRMKNYQHALNYFFNVWKYVKNQQNIDQSFKFKLLVNIAEVFKDQHQPDSAILYNTNALGIAKALHNRMGEAITLFNIADNYILKKDYDKALFYLSQSMPLSIDLGDAEGVSLCLNDYGEIYYQKNNYRKSIQYALNSLEKGKNLDNYENTRSSYNLLYLNYQQIGDFKKALNYRNLEISLDDSLNILKKEKQIQNILSDYELEKKQSQINILKKEKIIQQNIIEREKYTSLLGVTFTIVLLILIFLLYKSNADKKKLNQRLSVHNTAIIDQNQQLEKVNETKNILFSIIGHDLRGPFAYLLSMIDLMKDKAISPDEQDYFLSKLSENIQVTDHLLNNLLYWAKSQMDGFTSNKVDFDIQELVTQNINLLKARGDKKGIEIRQQGIMGIVKVHADEAMIDLVLRNLIENAMKFSKQGDSITINLENNKSFAKLAIIDTGKGISLEDQPKIFNKLSSFTTYGTNNEKGSGLGLLLCKELIEKNDGKIWFESEPGKGSTFYITIPNSNVALPPFIV